MDAWVPTKQGGVTGRHIYKKHHDIVGVHLLKGYDVVRSTRQLTPQMCGPNFSSKDGEPPALLVCDHLRFDGSVIHKVYILRFLLYKLMLLKNCPTAIFRSLLLKQTG